MRIVDLHPEDESLIEQAAQLLLVSFKEHWPEAWPDVAAAEQEVRESLAHDRISRVVLDEGDVVLGWIGGIRQYDGNVWELHPLAVHPDARGQGVGRALVEDLQVLARERGGLTLWLGTDDEDGMTTLSGVNLYPDIPGHIADIKNLKRHPYEFYQKLGFRIVGVMPDANGPGKPDIFMAKSLVSKPS